MEFKLTDVRTPGPTASHPATALYEALRKVADTALHAHEERVGKIAEALATAMGFPKDWSSQVGRACALHDIGKFAIPRSILAKSGPLDAEETREVRKHTLHGVEILRHAGLESGDMATRIVRYHHERFDGTGYPDGLSGNAIPIEARIAAVADVYDALRAERPYKPALSHGQAMTILLQGDERTSPDHFDPMILETLSKKGKNIDHICTDLLK